MNVIKSTEEKTVSFFKTVEAGDIALFNTFEEAIAVFGYTKAGKTCSCHILCNSIVKAENKNGELMYVPINKKYQSAIVGVGNDSQTEIPNIFETQVKNRNKVNTKVHVLDQPGYGDSYGFHRIFSNGYFHYRTFSKTPRLKFVLAFKRSDLEGTAEKFKKTILNFINMFVTYDYIKPKILAATVFLVTKADPKSKIQDITAVIKSLRSLISDLKEPKRSYYIELIQHMIEKGKIFLIEKPQQAGQNTRENTMLQQIYDKTEFWVRAHSKNVVDMSDVNFSVAQEILKSLGDFQDNELFREQYAHFMNYMGKRMDQILVSHPYSLKNLIEILKKDAVGPVDQHSFLGAMESFKETYYDFNDAYKEQRQKLEANLFKSNEDNRKEEVKPQNRAVLSKAAKEQEEKEKEKEKEREHEMRMVYFLKKFKVLEFIEEQTNLILNREEDETIRTIEELQGMSTFFIDMFKKMDILRLQRTDSVDIIYKYTYVIQRLIEQAKIITLILFNKNELRVHFSQYNDKHTIAFVDIFRLLKDKVFTHIGNKYSDENAIGKIKVGFCRQINIAKFEFVNEQIIKFFQDVEAIDQSFTKQGITLIIRYAEILNKNKLASDHEKKFVAFKLFTCRQKCFKYLKNLNANKNSLKKEKEDAIEQIFLLSNLLGGILTGFSLYEMARAVYKSVSNVEMVFKMFEAELKSLESSTKEINIRESPIKESPIKANNIKENNIKENNIKEYRKILMNYGHYAVTIHRKDLAMKCYQQAYSKSSLFKDIREAGKAIGDLQKKAEPTQAEDAYLRDFYNQNFCNEIDDSIGKQLASFCHPPKK